MENALVRSTVQGIQDLVGVQACRIGVGLQLDNGPNAVHQLDRVEKWLQSGVIDHQFIEAEDVAVPFDLSRKVGDRNADVIEFERRWLVM